ncbi:MAG: hypothetical protein KGR68_17480, partial [Betaproteobacteria bacterium]|nr:hypothetical protein [Betaproteobacteria bacterium]
GAQAGTVRFGYEGAERTLAVSSSSSDASLIAAIDAAIEGFTGIGAGNVTVTGTRAAGYTITFAGARAGQDLSAITLSFEPQVATASVSVTQQGQTQQTGTSTSGSNVRERQTISFANATGLTSVRYTLGKAAGVGAASAQLDFSKTSPTQNRETLQAALTGLYGAGNVVVSFDQSSTAAAPRYFIDFTGSLAYQDIGLIEVRSQSNVAVSVIETRKGSARTVTAVTQAVPAVQKVVLSNTAAGGTFTLGFKVGATSYTTAPVAVGASAATVRSALEALTVTGLSSAASWTVNATTGGYQITFGGGLAGQAIEPMTVRVQPAANSAQLDVLQRGLTRTTSQTVTTAAVNEVQRIALDDGDTTGRFTLSLKHAGTTYTTSAIEFGAPAAQVQQALLEAFAAGSLSGATVTVERLGSGRYELSFAGTLGGTDLELLQVAAQADSPVAQLSVVKAGSIRTRAPLPGEPDANLVVDFGVQSLTVKTGPTSTRTLDMEGSAGAQTRVTGQVTLDAYGFVRVQGGFSFEKSTTTVTTAQGVDVAVDQLTVGVGAVDAFVGVKGGTADAVGLQVEDLDFGLAIYTERSPGAGQAARKWSAMTGAAGAVSLVGISDVTLSGTNLSLAINRAAADGTVLDFAAARTRSLSTGPGTSVSLDLAGSAGPQLKARGTLTLGVFESSLSGTVSLGVTGSNRDRIEVGIDQAQLTIATGSAASDIKLTVSDISGAVLIEKDGASGVLRAGDIDLTDGAGAPFSAMSFGDVKGVEVGFNTTGRASQATIGQRGFDYSNEQYHDFFAVSADLKLDVSAGSVGYTLGGRFGISRQPMVLLEGLAPQKAFVVTLKEGQTALTVGSAPGGVRVGLGKLEGALILATLNNKFGAAGTLTIGEVSLTKADGVSELIPGLSILPVDLPFSF